MKKSLLFLFSDLANKLLKNYPKQIYLLFTLCLSISFFSCENEPVGSSDPTTEVKDKLPYTTKSMSLKDVPEVESYVRSILSIKTNKSATSKSINDLEHGASFDIEKIVETTDSINNKNYSIRFVFDDTAENVFYNLVVNFLPNGDKHAFVQKQTCNPENYIAFRNSKYNMKYFKGKIDLYYYTAFFGKKATAVLAKITTTATPCPQSYYPNGDPIPTLSAFIGSGGTDTGSGGSANTSNPNSVDSNASWPATGGYGLSVFSTSNNANSSALNGNNASNNSGGGLGSFITSIGSAITGFISSIGTAISDSYQNTFRWLRSFCGSCDPTRKTTDPCPTIVPLGFTTFISEPENLAILRSQILLSLEQWQWLHGKDDLMNTLLNYINTNPTVSKRRNALTIIDFFTLQNSFTSKDQAFVDEFIEQSIANPSLNLDFFVSYLSPMNVDVSSINPNTPEGAKFIEFYGALIKSQEFKKLFESIFKDNKRFNVKFEIGSVQNGANGNTNTDLNNPTLNTITISPDFLKNSNKMLIAKTIIHECIHAYLNVKLCDSGQGMPIPTLNDLDFFNVVNQQYNGFKGNQDQHNFIYNYMLPTMVTILSEVKDSLVTEEDNAIIESLTIRSVPPFQSVRFNWIEFFNNLCLSGLQSCEFFQNEIGTFDKLGNIIVVKDQVKMDFYNQYNNYGKLYLRN